MCAFPESQRLISDPRFSAPATYNVSHATQGKWQFSSDSSANGYFPCVAWEKPMLQGVENRGSLISVPVALRAFFPE